MSSFSHSLKTWRKARRFSQLELAIEANVSSRHIAFLETGRANPSPTMIDRLGDALDLPLSARNQMLNLAGFAARYAGSRLDAEEMAPVRMAMQHMLDGHEPYPALAADRMWNILALNRMGTRLFSPLGIAIGSSLLDLMLSETMPALIENWPDVAHHAAQRLRTESAAQGGIAEFDHVADQLSRVPDPGRKAVGPVMPTIYRVGAIRLSLFAVIAQFGTPEDVTIDDLKIELYFPADKETDAALRLIAKSEPTA